MKHLLFLCFLLIADNCANAQTSMNETKKTYALVIHGGAGNIMPDNLPKELQERYKISLEKALAAGEQILSSGGAAIDAVQAAIMVMEDDSLFNAGKGSVYTNEEKIEMDASIMDGKDLNAGAVAGVTTIKNPIMGARYVMDKSKHVMLSGKGAEHFAKDNDLEIVKPDYFETQYNKKDIKKIKEREGKKSSLPVDKDAYSKYGTVGAVAMDINGNLAAGTSTGGMANKKFGRIGDSPIIGAGTYAD
ncbi:MAG: isoaspartyl peptidase/L-asparaginase, partial [Chitinophagaceae bacterium]|nr:isoaspartyl peptidase/L-asparaginase [Chitinophagaceae bacterium]